ncbi:hypothetical protein TNCV_703431 [Trichonephila clavipes]|nr:hypothetical protein TNCV_703431 [Trichonephila clavipes]
MAQRIGEKGKRSHLPLCWGMPGEGKETEAAKIWHGGDANIEQAIRNNPSHKEAKRAKIRRDPQRSQGNCRETVGKHGFYEKVESLGYT